MNDLPDQSDADPFDEIKDLITATHEATMRAIEALDNRTQAAFAAHSATVAAIRQRMEEARASIEQAIEDARRARRAQMEHEERPWDALGISRATYYRRRRDAGISDTGGENET